MKTKEQVRSILEQYHSCCLDDEEDRERLLNALFHNTTYVLGPGLSVTCDHAGIKEFVFLDEDDLMTVIPVEELDPGWKDVLLKALE